MSNFPDGVGAYASGAFAQRAIIRRFTVHLHFILSILRHDTPLSYQLTS